MPRKCGCIVNLFTKVIRSLDYIGRVFVVLIMVGLCIENRGVMPEAGTCTDSILNRYWGVVTKFQIS